MVWCGWIGLALLAVYVLFKVLEEPEAAALFAVVNNFGGQHSCKNFVRWLHLVDLVAD